jgi:hypothetical protein
LLSGMCATKLPNGSPAMNHIGCLSAASSFLSPTHMSHATYSIVLSACLSDDHSSLVCGAMNIPDASELNLVLSRRRADLVRTHGISDPLHSIFDGFEKMQRLAGVMNSNDLVYYVLDITSDSPLLL